MFRRPALPATLALLSLAFFALPSPVMAAKGEKAAARRAARKANQGTPFVQKFDTNANSIIDAGEVETLRQAYAAEPAGPLRQFDTNVDGTIDDLELAAIKAPVPGEAKPPGKRKKKKLS
jgi:hypothetical protein